MTRSRLDELTRMGRVDVRTFDVVPDCYTWPTCQVCGATFPRGTGGMGVQGETTCPTCAEFLRQWASRRIERDAERRRERERRERIERANRCTCTSVELCEPCRAWMQQTAALEQAERGEE